MEINLSNLTSEQNVSIWDRIYLDVTSNPLDDTNYINESDLYSNFLCHLKRFYSKKYRKYTYVPLY